VIGCLGLALLLVGSNRPVRLAGLACWGVGLGALSLSLAPDVSRTVLAAGAASGAVVAVAGAWALLRWPFLLPFVVLLLIPVRIPVDIGSEEANLLLPLYVVVAAQALALAWQLLHGDHRVRELGWPAWPLAGLVAWSGVTILWTDDVRKGTILLGAFVVPFGLIAIAVARLPWRGRMHTWLWGALVGTALVYALVGGYQWLTRDVFWNPGVIVGNAYAPFFRVNSVFWDPSVYGRYLAVAVLVTLAGILLGGVRGWRVVGLYVVVCATWVGLLVSFSQSSFVALATGIIVAAAVAWGARAVAALVVLAIVSAALTFMIPQVRDQIVDKSRTSINKVTSGRSNLVGQGVRIGLDYPVTGVGTGGFSREYARRRGIPGKDPKRTASHTTPVTVFAETGLVGLGLFLALVASVLVTTLRGLGRGFTSRVSLAVGLAFVAIVIHSMFYAAFFEDPMTWALLGLAGVVARVPKKAAVPALTPVSEAQGMERLTP
jgi:hypothetical protein